MENEEMEFIDPTKELISAYSISSSDLLKFLEEKGLDDMPCELCRAKEWAITSSGGDKPDVFVNQVMGNDNEGGIGQMSRAFYYCFCTGCGNTKQFYASYILSLIDPQRPEAENFKDRYRADGTKAG